MESENEAVIYRVKNPEYLTDKEIREKYWCKQVLVTNIVSVPEYGEMQGGIVRYYATNCMGELYGLLTQLRLIEGAETLDCCSVYAIGPVAVDYIGLLLPAKEDNT